MTKKYIKNGAEGFNATPLPLKINNLTQKLSENQQQKLYQELKSSGSINNPTKYTETHLEGSDADDENRRTDRPTGKTGLE